MWTGPAIVGWLQTLGIGPGGSVVDVEALDVGQEGSDLPQMPNRAAFIYPTQGTGEILDGVADVRGFQLRLRWDPGDPHGCERAIRAADRAITRADVPAWFEHPDDGLTRVIAVGRPGGGPSPLGGAASADGDRATWVCTYLITVSEYDD